MKQLHNVYCITVYSLFFFHLLLHFFKMDSTKSDCILIIVYLFIDFKICKTLYRLLKIYEQNFEQDRIHVYSFKLKSELMKIFWNKHLIFTVLLWSAVLIILSKNILDEIMVLIFIPIVIDHWISDPNKNDVLETNNLHIGYGAALNYYKNYLELNMPYHFKERIENFKSYHNVDLQNKLFILVPESCRIHHYLESEDGNIERCQELPTEEITHGGVKNRVYNITVYLIRTHVNGNGIRMAVEYAQPLKTLFALKDKGLIAETEMLYQRKLFAKTLKKFLSDDNAICKCCEIIEYDDNRKEVSEILLESYYNSYCETV